jgi:hypothetical protein
MRTGDLYQLAADLAFEHGTGAVAMARYAVASLELEGNTERAQFWTTVSVLLDDIVSQRLDPTRPVVIH